MFLSVTVSLLFSWFMYCIFLFLKLVGILQPCLGQYTSMQVINFTIVNVIVLFSEGDSDLKQKAVRVQVLSTHGSQGPQNIS